MTQTVLQIIVNGEDNASKVLGGVGSSLASLGKLALGAGLAVGGALAGALALSVNAASEAEDIQAQLNATLESTRGVAGMTAEAINQHALALSTMTRFEDDAIVQADALLLTFTRIGSDVFPQATEAILDMATKMKMDLQSATVLVGKALNDPVKGVTALTRAGVQFSKAQQDMIEKLVQTGDLASAQAIILQELNTQFGGSAKAAGETFAGQLDILKNGLGNVAEEIGVSLLPMLVELVTWAAPRLVSGFRKFGDWINGGIPKIRELFGTLGEAKDIIGGIVNDINAGRGIRWQSLFNLAGLFTEKTDLKIRFAETVQDIQAVIEDIKIAFQEGGLRGAVDKVTELIGQGLREAFAKVDWEKIKTDLVTHWDTTLQPALKTAITNLNDFTRADPQLFADVGAAIGAAINAGIAQYQQTNKQGGQLGVIVAQMMGENIDGSTFWDAFGKSIQRGVVSPTLQNAINGVMDAILAKVIEANPTLTNYIETVKSIIQNIKDADKEFGTFGQSLSRGLTNPFQAIVDVVNTLITAIQTAINKWWEWVNATGGGTPAAPGGGVPHDPSGWVGPAAGGSSGSGGGIPGAGRMAGGMNVTIHINAPGGDPTAVANAAQTGVLRAARSMGLA